MDSFNTVIVSFFVLRMRSCHLFLAGARAAGSFGAGRLARPSYWAPGLRKFARCSST